MLIYGKKRDKRKLLFYNKKRKAAQNYQAALLAEKNLPYPYFF